MKLTYMIAAAESRSRLSMKNVKSKTSDQTNSIHFNFPEHNGDEIIENTSMFSRDDIKWPVSTVHVYGPQFKYASSTTRMCINCFTLEYLISASKFNCSGAFETDWKVDSVIKRRKNYFDNVRQGTIKFIAPVVNSRSAII